MITSKLAQKMHNNLKSWWSEESKLSQKILISILAQLESKPQRKPSAYMRFFGNKIKEGLSAQEIGKLWKKQK